jgi:hypothetical protein
MYDYHAVGPVNQLTLASLHQLQNGYLYLCVPCVYCEINMLM